MDHNHPACVACDERAQSDRRRRRWIGIASAVTALSFLTMGGVYAQSAKRLTLTGVYQELIGLRARLENVENIISSYDECGAVSACKEKESIGEKQEEVATIAPSCVMSCKENLVSCLKVAGTNGASEKSCFEKSDGCYRSCDPEPPQKPEISCLGKCKEASFLCIKDAANESGRERQCVITQELCFKGCQEVSQSVPEASPISPPVTVTPRLTEPVRPTLPTTPTLAAPSTPLPIAPVISPPLTTNQIPTIASDLAVREITENALRVDWIVPNDPTITQFEIRLWRNRTERATVQDWPYAYLSWGESVRLAAGERQYFWIRDLTPGTNYVIGVRGCTRDGRCSDVLSSQTATRR